MKRSLVVVAHNIRSLWNVGAIFRVADTLGVSHVHLTGYTAAPPRKEISKTALGAEEWIPWTHDDVSEVLKKRKTEGYAIVSLEIAEGSIPLSEFKAPQKICLVIGHEILGVPKEILELSDAIVHIPMVGKKHSLNVSTAFAVAAYVLTRGSATRSQTD